MPVGRRIEARVAQSMARMDSTTAGANRAIQRLEIGATTVLEEILDGFDLVPVIDQGLAEKLHLVFGAIMGGDPLEEELELPIRLRVKLREDDDIDAV